MDIMDWFLEEFSEELYTYYTSGSIILYQECTEKF